MKILMVCLGNICRSPLAHGIMQHLVEEDGLDWEVDSAGTGSWHVGQKPDHRSIAVAKRHGVDISSQRARQFQVSDFEEFDFIFVMDESNYADVILLTRNEEERAKVKLLIKDGKVPDPYYEDTLFEPVFQMIHTQCEELFTQLKNDNG